LKIVYNKKFLKDLSQITTPEKKRIEFFCLHEIQLSNPFNLSEASKKSKGIRITTKLDLTIIALDFITKMILFHLKEYWTEKRFTDIFRKSQKLKKRKT
jgi:hypothetical protein